MMSRLPGENLNKTVFFYKCPMQIWTLKICNQNITNTIIGTSFKLGQLIEDDK